MDLWHLINMKVILTLWTLTYVACGPFSCTDSFHIVHNQANELKKNLSEKHNETSITLTVFDHGLKTLLSIFHFLIYLFIPLNTSVYILMIYKWSKIRAWFAFWLNINEINWSKYMVKNLNPTFLDSALLLLFYFFISFVSPHIK